VLNPSTDRNDAEAHQALTPLIKQEADRHGILTFARFMELALYTPGLGYYERSEKVIGQSGDFFTSVSVGQVFGELLACQFADWLENSPAQQPVIIECAAHNGQLALDILDSLYSNHRPHFDRIEYWIVENSEVRRHWQNALLSRFSGKVRWFHSWTDLSSFQHNQRRTTDGVLFSNELLDSLPFHRLQWNGKSGVWTELGVRPGANGLEFAAMPLSVEVRDYAESVRQTVSEGEEQLLWPNIPDALLEILPDGFMTEVCPAAVAWWTEAAEVLGNGRLVGIDYGLRADEFFRPERVNGTARAFRGHKFISDLLANPGEQDITASVNFSIIQRTGELAGLKTERLDSQSRFFTRIVSETLKDQTAFFTSRRKSAFHTLTHPNHLGRAFTVLVQSKTLNAATSVHS